jgi:hypothetical protein
VGRTTLLRRILTLDATFRSVYFAGTAAESGLPYAGLHQVVQAHRCSVPQLPAPQRDLLGHLLDTGHHRLGDTALAVGAAALGLLSAAAARRPLLLAIDDAHLLDAPSMKVLLFVARRIAGEPIAMLLTAEHSCSAATSAIRPAVTGVPEMRLGPLDPADGAAQRPGALPAGRMTVPWTAPGTGAGCALAREGSTIAPPGVVTTGTSSSAAHRPPARRRSTTAVTCRTGARPVKASSGSRQTGPGAIRTVSTAVRPAVTCGLPRAVRRRRRHRLRPFQR